MPRASVIAANVSTAALQYNGGGVIYPIQKLDTPDTWYLIFVDTASDLVYIKSTDGGFTWTNPVAIFTGTMVAQSCWYERWSGISGDKVHCAYVESGGSDILYRSLDIASDTLGTQTTVFNGTSSAGGGSLSITVSKNGDLRVVGSIDAGAEDGAWSSTDGGATWSDTIADPSEGATQDQYFALPGYNADTADFMVIFVDASANGISVKRYDDSANTWSESAIIADGSFVDGTPNNSFPHVACFPDLANNRNIVACWTGIDSAGADLRCFIVTDTTITETSTNIVLDSGDDQGLVGMSLDINTGRWHAFYAGKSDGSETWTTSLKIYTKSSSDDGATWTAETEVTTILRAMTWMTSVPRFQSKYMVAFQNDTSVSDTLVVNVQFPIQPRARVAIGVS